MIDGEGGECWHRMVRMATNECFYISSPFSSSVFVSMLELHVSVAWCLVLTMFGAACGSYLGDFSSQQTSGLCAEAIFPPIFASIHYTLNSGLLSTGVSALHCPALHCTALHCPAGNGFVISGKEKGKKNHVMWHCWYRL